MSTQTTHMKLLDTLPQQLNSSHTALLIIDMQKDFCTRGFAADRTGKDLTAFNTITPNIEKLLKVARQQNVLVCHIGFGTFPQQMSDSAPWLVQRKKAAYATTDIATIGTEGADFIAELTPLGHEIQVYKQRFSGFKGTNLDLLLRAHEIKTVVLSGASTNVCVESTLRDAFETGYYVVVPKDGVCSWDMTLHEASLKTFERRFGFVTSCDKIMEIWRQS